VLTYAEQWDPVSKQPQFKSGAVRITKIDPAGKEKVHAPELQTAAIKAKEEHNKAITKPGGLNGEDKRTESFLQYWLGATYASMETLRDICDHLMSRITHSDYEVTSGMRIMHRLITSCVDRLGPITVKYRSENEYGRQTSLELKKRLFPEAEVGDISGSNAYDVLIALQSFYMFLGHVESHIIAMSPAAQATWDREFIEAVNFLNTQVGRMYAWTKQQLASRGPQTLLVPCSEAAELKDRIKDVLDTQ